MNIPRRLDFGAGDLVELDYLCEIFGICRRTAAKYLTVLHIKPMTIGKQVFFSLNTFKRIMFVLSRPGAPGFLFPGSAGKNNPRFLKDERFIAEVTDDILKQAADPAIMAEMAASDGRDMSVIKQFVARPVGRPTKKEKEDGTA